MVLSTHSPKLNAYKTAYSKLFLSPSILKIWGWCGCNSSIISKWKSKHIISPCKNCFRRTQFPSKLQIHLQSILGKNLVKGIPGQPQKNILQTHIQNSLLLHAPQALQIMDSAAKLRGMRCELNPTTQVCSASIKLLFQLPPSPSSFISMFFGQVANKTFNTQLNHIKSQTLKQYEAAFLQRFPGEESLRPLILKSFETGVHESVNWTTQCIFECLVPLKITSKLTSIHFPHSSAAAASRWHQLLLMVPSTNLNTYFQQQPAMKLFESILTIKPFPPHRPSGVKYGREIVEYVIKLWLLQQKKIVTEAQLLNSFQHLYNSAFQLSTPTSELIIFPTIKSYQIQISYIHKKLLLIHQEHHNKIQLFIQNKCQQMLVCLQKWVRADATTSSIPNKQKKVH
jgi:hypothetical protein